ncbi:MAG: FtsQ-type POTRA domain-containing protein [Sphaerochaetaceae bacterium]|nr:FtsQ-type POTRA domain-containing protein [Sphaerochaetaceae bacterium]
MNLKTVRTAIIVFALVVLCLSSYVAVRHLSYFDVKSVDVSFTGSSDTLSAEMERIVSPLKGMNVFAVNLSKIKAELEKTDGVESVEIRRFFPDRIELLIHWKTVELRIEAEGDFYIVSDGTLVPVTQGTWSAFGKLPSVKLDISYARLVEKWGYDEGFVQMLQLASSLTDNTLITGIKYDNNNSNGFGRLILDVGFPPDVLYVREPVTAQRLSEALDIVRNEMSSGENGVRYDLYANALVKRI